jgi:hypothetical protein
MSLGEFLRKSLMSFFIIVTCVSVVIGTLGLIYEPNRRIGYEAYFSPLIFGVIGVLPSIVTYSKKELTIKQMIFRKVLQLLLLEILILSFMYRMGIMEPNMALLIALSVFGVFLIVHFISWIIDRDKAAQLNQDLKLFQGRY